MEIFGSMIANVNDLSILAVRFLIDILFASILILGIYFRINHKTKYLFNFYIFNILIFFVASLLNTVTMQTGFAFGLFAIFSILRYRTKQIPIKEMSYLFIAIVIATINSTVTSSLSYIEILFANTAIIAISFILEKVWARHYRPSQVVVYEKIDLIVPERKSDLIDDLEKRLGRRVSETEILKVNFLTDSASIKVFF